MKKINAFIFLILLSLIVFNAAFAQQRNLKNELVVYIVPDSLEIKENLNDGGNNSEVIVNSKALASLLKRLGPVKVTKAFPSWKAADSIKINPAGFRFKAPAFDRIFVFSFDKEAKVADGLKSLKETKSVLFAEGQGNTAPADNFVKVPFKNKRIAKLKSNSRLTDPAFLSGAQWHHKNDGSIVGAIAGADMNTEDAWAIFTGSSGVTISIFDSGIDLAHEEFTGRVIGETYDPGNIDSKSHGTNVAGLAAANANNSKGGRGVDWNAKLSSRRIFDAGGYIGDTMFATKIIAATNAGEQVANYSAEGLYSTTVALAINYAYMMNVTSVAAMGNNRLDTTQYPAGYNNVIAVGSSTINDTHASVYSNTGNHIDVTAPGGTTWAFGTAQGLYTTDLGNTYALAVGTSHSTPLVSGLASLLKGYNNNLYNDDITNIIKLTSKDIDVAGFDPRTGVGRIDAGKALTALQLPNRLHHFSASGGSIHSTSSLYSNLFYSVSGIPDGTYFVKRIEVRKAVTFPYAFCNIVGAWGRGAASTGLNSQTINLGEGFTEVVPGTLTSTGATLRT